MTEAKLKTELDYYDIVRQKLEIGPLTYPKDENIFKIMKTFWDEETIKLLSHFPPVGDEISVDELAEKSGLTKKEIKQILKPSARKRTLIKHGKRYELAPLLPGIFEAYYIIRADTIENQTKAAEAYRYLFKHMTDPPIIAKDYEFFRPLLPIETKGKLIKIDESVESQQQVLPYELVEDLINNNEEFAYLTCQCRLIGELTGEPCEVAPAEMGCFIAGPKSKALSSTKRGTALTKEEAIEYLKKTEKAGLVHLTSNSKGGEHLRFICNCCACHCGILLAVKEHGLSTAIPSNFRPTINHELCVKCKTCIKKCPMDAISFNEAEEQIVITYDPCIGCGLCATNCKEGAMMLEKVRNVIPPERKPLGKKTFSEHINDLMTSG